MLKKFQPGLLAVALAACGIPCLFAQSSSTTVSGTIVGPGGTNPSGTATISWQRTLNDANPRATIYPGSTVLNITAGVVSIALFPNAAMLPISTCYTVNYALNGQNSRRYWYVPISATPVNLQTVEGDQPCPTQSGAIIAPAQISPGGSGLTQVLTSGPTGLVSWVTGGGGGGGSSPGGIVNSVQYNAGSGNFGGISNLTTNGANPQLTAIPAPAAPFPGFGVPYEDSTSLNLTFINSAGAITHTVQTKAAVANQFLTSIAGNGTVGQAQPSFSNLSGSVACSQMPALTGDTTSSAGGCPTVTVKVDGVSYPSGPSINTVPVVTSAASGGTVTYEAVPNAALANSTVTPNGQTCTLGSTCNVNTGATAHSLSLNEGNGSAITGLSLVDHQVVIGVTGADPIAKTLVDCQDTAGQHYNFTLSTNTWSCGTSGGVSGYATIDSNGSAVTQRAIVNFVSGSNATVACVDNAGATRTDCTVSASSSAGSRLDQISAATGANSINSADNAQVWNWSLTTSGKSAFTFSENSASTAAGTPFLVNISTLSTSTLNPIQITAQGTSNGLRMNTSGVMAKIGTGSLVADAIGTLSSVAGITSAGLGVPAIGWVSNVTGRTTSQPTVTLATAPTSGSYRLIYYANESTVCTTGSEAVSFTFNWTDAGNARVLNTGTVVLGATQSTSGYLSGEFPIFVGSGNVTYTSTISGTCLSGTAAYDIHASLERLQ